MSELLVLLIEVTAVFAVALLGVRLASWARAAVRHLILASAFCVVLILPLATLVSPQFVVEISGLPPREAAPITANAITAIPVVSEPIDVQPSNVETTAPAMAAITPPAPARSVPATTWLFLLWAVVALITLVPVGASLSHLRSIHRRAQPWPEGAARLQQLMHPAVARCPIVLLDDVIAAPITAGFVQPVIALPADAVAWSDIHVANALLHELEHVRRRDWPVHLATRAVCALYWFHPLAWLAWRALRLEAERACDDAVLSREDAATYAEQLLGLARRLADKHGLPGMQMASTSNLSSRIRAVLDNTRPRGRAGRIALACIVIAAVVTVAALAPLRATGPTRVPLEPVATNSPTTSSTPATDMRPAATPPEPTFPYDTRVGLVALRDDGGCLSIFNSSVAAGTKLTLVRPRSSDDPAGVMQATVGDRQAKECPASLDRQHEAGIDPTYYRIAVSGSNKPPNGQVWAILDPPGSIVLRDGQIEADVEGDGLRESFETCTSRENVHYMVWTQFPAQRRKRWHGNVYYGPEMEPTCSDEQYAEVGAVVNSQDLYIRGQRLSVEAGRLSPDHVSAVTPAKVCVVASGACFEAPKYHGLNPQAELVELKPDQSALLFRAVASASGSGSSTALSMLDLKDGRFVNLTPGILLSEQSEYALWKERDVSDAPVLVTADYVYGSGETHFSRHRFRIQAFVLDAARAAGALPEYILRSEFVTDERYPSLDELGKVDVLSKERANVLARLRKPLDPANKAREGSGGAVVDGVTPPQDRISEFKASCGKQAWNGDKCAQAGNALEKQGAAAVPALQGLLGDPDFNVVREAVTVLGKMGAAAAPAAPGLVQALGHDHGGVTDAAVTALGKLAPQVPSIVPALIRIVEAIPRNRGQGIVQVVHDNNALSALGAIGPPAEAAIPTLVAVMKAMKTNPYNYSLPDNIATALEKIGAAKNPELARERTYPMDPKIEAALVRYETIYKSISGSNAPSADTVVRLYNSFTQLHDAFTSTLWHGNDSEFRRIETRAPGVKIWSEEFIAMFRDMPFFKELADRTRNPDAVRLFTLLQETYPNVLLFCEDRVSDYGSCTMFGDGKFADFYGRWSDFRPANTSIQGLVQAERARIIEAMKADCVCPANAEPVIREYELFLARFPANPASDDLRKRLSEIKAGTARIKFGCRPG